MKKGVLCIEGPESVCGDKDCYCCAEFAKKRHSIIQSKAELMVLGDGRGEKLSIAYIKDVIHDVLKNYEDPTILFNFHAKEFCDCLMLSNGVSDVSSYAILDFIKKHSGKNSSVDCGFFTCFGGLALRDIQLLPEKSCMISLANAVEYNYSKSTVDFYNAIARTEGDFSLKNSFIEYIRGSSYKTSNPMIGSPQRGIFELPRHRLNQGKDKRIRFSNQVTEFMR